MKAFKCLPILLAVLLLASACNMKQDRFVYPDLKYIYYPGIRWNMTIKEFFTSTNEKVENYILEEDAKEHISSSHYRGKKSNFLGRSSYMSVYFSSNMYEEEETLRNVSFLFEDEMSYSDFESICTELEKFAQHQEANTQTPILSQKGDGTTSWTLPSAATSSDLPENDKEKINNWYHYVTENIPESLDYFQVFENKPLIQYLRSILQRIKN